MNESRKHQSPSSDKNTAVQEEGYYVDIGDTRLFVEERGSGYPVLILHGGPGVVDHRFFGNYLDALCDQYRLILIDARSQGRSEPAPQATWSFQQFVQDVSAVARAMKLRPYAVLGHSYGAFVALQHAVSFPGDAAQTIISNGVPSMRFLWQHVERSLREFVPESLRDQIAASWEREKTTRTAGDVATLLHEQMPFHFANPRDPRIANFEKVAAPASFGPDMLRHFAAQGYGPFDCEARLTRIKQPLLV